GVLDLLDAFRRVRAREPRARLVVVGSSDAARVAALRASSGERDGVEWAGAVSDAALPAHYRAADVFCAPSVDYESFGIVLLEAMAAGVPIVASDIAAYREV